MGRSHERAAIRFGRRLIGAWEATGARVAELVPEISRSRPGGLLPAWAVDPKGGGPGALDMLARMVFSALVDADFLDTEAHFSGAPQADVACPRSATLPTGTRSGAAICSPSGSPRLPTSGALTSMRKPSRPRRARSGMYRLAAPTGSGKTITAGGFAINHARAHGLRRVILAVPFISITEQNAAVYRDLLDEPGSPVVLEHHSGADLDAPDAAAAWWRKLAAENWDAPFVVTTTVQLFQSLFDHRPAAMRKLHRLAGSVIVLDEVQALPDRLLMPILSALAHADRAVRDDGAARIGNPAVVLEPQALQGPARSMT